jgi:hypothetical protein
VENNGLLAGDLVLYINRHARETGVIIAKRRANNDLSCSPKKSDVFYHYQWVYYVLLNNGYIEGPLFYTELSKL